MQRTTDEVELVGQWREEQFLQLEFTPRQAALLTQQSADYHQAADLLGRGCPPEIAVEILLD